MSDADFTRTPADTPEGADADPLALMDFTEAEEAPARRREGLPPAYRMRHPPHYVEQLMGEAPIQIVRRIATAEVEGPVRPGLDLAALTDSVRRFGILQPLIVSRSRGASSYRVIAGANRLAAARLAALATVPCLVIEGDDADDEHVTSLRSQAALRGVEPAAMALVEPCDDDDVQSPEATGTLLRLAFREIAGLLGCLNTLVPLAAEDGAPGFRGSIVRDLMLVEADRTTTIAAAAALLTRPVGRQGFPQEAVDCGEVLSRLREKFDVAARLKGVAIQWPGQPDSATIRGQFQALVTAWSSLLYAYLTLARAGDRLVVMMDVPRVRPAVILQVSLYRQPGGDRDELPAGEMAGGTHQIAGTAVAVMIGAVERCARQHAGRFVQELTSDSARALFVIPVPVD